MSKSGSQNIILINSIFRFSAQKTMRIRKRRKNKQISLKTEVIASLIEEKNNHDENLSERNISKVDDAITGVKDFETIIKIKKKGIMNFG